MYPSLIFLLLSFVIPAASYTPDDVILLNCGASQPANDTSGRPWTIHDQRLSYSPQNAATPVHTDKWVLNSVPYETAWIFQSQFKSSFSLKSKGHKFLRLYFNPTTYSTFNTSISFFSVTANGFTLLTNFGAFLHSRYVKQPTLIKEFIINVEGDPRINLTFSPDPHSFAFINGIEIVSIPDNLYLRTSFLKFLPNRLIQLQNNTAFETLHRPNVGGADIQIQEDTGMFRYWTQDDDYIFGGDYGYTPHTNQDYAIQYTNATPNYSAPKIVYQSMRTMANTSISLEWVFPVDAGFLYLLRFHFCEFLLEITKAADRVSTIKIGDETAELEADVIFWTGGNGIPIFKDYVAWVPDNHTHHGKTDLRLSLFPRVEAVPKYLSAFLNGLEIFKISDLNHSLAAGNPDPVDLNTTSFVPQDIEKKGRSFTMKYGVVVGLGVVAIFAIIVAVIFHVSGRCMKPANDAQTFIKLDNN